mmetsp:Transcript_23685/g.27378  ORF Transcript_23685/g.27378 Transcript_23685/m.27378 type:complete len:265 (-) Transcript_23685:62-856(-)
MSDLQWKEYNPEFGYHELKHHNVEENDDFHEMEFELDSIPKITLRGKTKISESTGLTIWSSSQVLFGYLDDHPHLVQGKQVLELGAGLGLCSIAAHHLGAKRVLATDGDVDVLENLRHNIKYNVSLDVDVIDRSHYSMNNSDEIRTISCPQLVWGKDLEVFRDAFFQAEVIIGTDVLYFTRCLDPCWQTVDALLKPDGLFLLSFATHSVTIAEVLDKARHYGFTWKKPNITGESEEEFDEKDYTSTSEFGYHLFIFSRQDESVE